MRDVDALFDEDMLGDDLEAWMDESSMLQRSFRNVAVIAGLIERRHPGEEKTGKQVTFNSDLIYDVLRRHEPDHILLRATRADAAGGLTDVARLADMLRAHQGPHRLPAPRPRLAAGACRCCWRSARPPSMAQAIDELMDEAATALIEEATAEEPAPELPL